MREVDDELREIKREIIESRGLVIKTNNLTNALSADIKSIAKRQQTYERRISWNSATAYIVFVVVVFAALKFAVDARFDGIEAKYKHLSAENERLKKFEQEVDQRDKDRRAHEDAVAQIYDLSRQGKKVELVKAYDRLKERPLSKTEQMAFADLVERAKNDLSASFYQQGLENARLQRWQEAVNNFEQSLSFKDDTPLTPSVRLAQAQAYRKLKKCQTAIPILQQLSEQRVDLEVIDDALYTLAGCQMDVEAWNEAKNTWRTLLRKFPETSFRLEAQHSLQQLTAYH